MGYHAGVSFLAEQMLNFKLKSTDDLLYVPGSDNSDKDEDALFKFHGMRRMVRMENRPVYQLSFNKKVTDLHKGGSVEEDEDEKTKYFLSEEAFLALTACF